LKKGQVLVVEGIIEKDDYSDSVKHKMIAERILTFDEARREYIKNIKIDIENNNGDTLSVVNSLKEIATSSEGNSVLISYKGSSAKADIALPNHFSVKLDDASIKALGKRFGAENVEFVYHTQTHIN
jgi:DNA polymerase III alpha subunit